VHIHNDSNPLRFAIDFVILCVLHEHYVGINVIFPIHLTVYSDLGCGQPLDSPWLQLVILFTDLQRVNSVVVVPICKVCKHGQSVTRFKRTQFAVVGV